MNIFQSEFVWIFHSSSVVCESHKNNRPIQCALWNPAWEILPVTLCVFQSAQCNSHTYSIIFSLLECVTHLLIAWPIRGVQMRVFTDKIFGCNLISRGCIISGASLWQRILKWTMNVWSLLMGEMYWLLLRLLKWILNWFGDNCTWSDMSNEHCTICLECFLKVVLPRSFVYNNYSYSYA